MVVSEISTTTEACRRGATVEATGIAIMARVPSCATAIAQEDIVNQIAIERTTPIAPALTIVADAGTTHVTATATVTVTVTTIVVAIATVMIGGVEAETVMMVDVVPRLLLLRRVQMIAMSALCLFSKLQLLAAVTSF